MQTQITTVVTLALLLLATGAETAQQRPYDRVRVDAKTNSSTGGVGKDTNFDVLAGETLIITADARRRWSAGPDTPYSRKSTADGLGRLSQHTQFGLTANFGALVGRIGSGPFFLVGARYRGRATQTGRLRLYYWDSNSADNSGSIRVKIQATGGSCATIKAHHDRLARANGVMGAGRGQTVAAKLALVKARIARLSVAQDSIEGAMRKTEAGVTALEKLSKQNDDRSTFDAPAKGGVKAVSYGALQALKTAASKAILGWVGVAADLAESTGRAMDKAETAKNLAGFLAQSNLNTRALYDMHIALSADIRTELARERALTALGAQLAELYARWSACVTASQVR